MDALSLLKHTQKMIFNGLAENWHDVRWIWQLSQATRRNQNCFTKNLNIHTVSTNVTNQLAYSCIKYH